MKLKCEVKNQSNIFKVIKMSSIISSTGGKHTCQVCGYQALKKTQLKLHDLTVHDGGKFQCPECEYKATWEKSLVSHQ
jgi:ribosomal protein L37AE/L43A